MSQNFCTFLAISVDMKDFWQSTSVMSHQGWSIVPDRVVDQGSFLIRMTAWPFATAAAIHSVRTVTSCGTVERHARRTMR